jgi:hypothetical protein
MADQVLNPVFGIDNYPAGAKSTTTPDPQQLLMGINNYDNGVKIDIPSMPKQEILRDYQHAARIFTDSQFRLSPKFGFLFYVEFDFNPLISTVSNNAARELGVIVKSVSLPKFSIDTKIHNAYNRKNIVQNKINYDPVTISFHDDQADNVRNFWYDYYSYFYRDPDYNDVTYTAPHKYQSRSNFEWGYTPRPMPIGSYYTSTNSYQQYQYIQAIRIYSLYQGQFSEYELINPIITSFKHGDHSMNESGLMQHDMTVQYETVKYLTGYVTHDNAGGFIDLHYDNTPSPNATTETTVSPSDIINDLADSPATRNPYYYVNNSALNSLIGGAGTFSSTFNQSTLFAAGSVINNGGISVPSFGSLARGVSTSSSIGQQLQAAGFGIVNQTASTLSNAVTGGIAAGLGSNGQSIVAMAAQAIANPKAALNTVTNMATQYAIGYASNAINAAVGKVAGQISEKVGDLVSENIAKPASEAWDIFSAKAGATYESLTQNPDLSAVNFGDVEGGASLSQVEASLTANPAFDASEGWSI